VDSVREMMDIGNERDAKIVMLSVYGHTRVEVARMVGCGEMAVFHVRRRYAEKITQLSKMRDTVLMAQGEQIIARIYNVINNNLQRYDVAEGGETLKPSELQALSTTAIRMAELCKAIGGGDAGVKPAPRLTKRLEKLLDAAVVEKKK